MATNKVITVTVIPTRTGDTVASYNAYSSIDGLLGSLSVAEASAGKTFALSDGSSHNITVKTVWTTAGESTTNVSNIVVIDLSSTVSFTLTGMIENSPEIYTNNSGASYSDAYGISVTSYPSDFDFEVSLDAASGLGAMMGISSSGTNRAWNNATPWDYGMLVDGSGTGDISTIIAGSLGTPDTPDVGVVAVGNKIRLIRVSNNLKLYYYDGTLNELHNFGTVSGTVFLHISAFQAKDIRYPRVTV